MRSARALALLTALAGAGSAGCETFGPRTCDTSPGANPSLTYNGGHTQDGVYMTSAWTGDLLSFPGGMRYSLVHGLTSDGEAATPAWIQSYLSFDRTGTGDGGTVVQASGNQVEIVGVDDQHIDVANDSCSDYWLLVVAGGAETAPPSP